MKLGTIKVLLGLWSLCACIEPLQAAPASPAPSLSPVARYAARVQIIHNDLKWSLASLHVALEQLEDVQAEIARRKTTDDAEASAGKVRRDEARTALLQAMTKVRANARRLRALSPVPRSLKKMDDRLIESGLDMERALDVLSMWTLHPASELKNQAARQLRRSTGTLETALRELARRTEPAIAGKVYVDG